MNGMTIKQMQRAHFLRLAEAYRETESFTRREFVQLSIALHAAKGGVPKRWWSMARRTKPVTLREEAS